MFKDSVTLIVQRGGASGTWDLLGDPGLGASPGPWPCVGCVLSLPARAVLLWHVTVQSPRGTRSCLGSGFTWRPRTKAALSLGMLGSAQPALTLCAPLVLQGLCFCFPPSCPAQLWGLILVFSPDPLGVRPSVSSGAAEGSVSQGSAWAPAGGLQSKSVQARTEEVGARDPRERGGAVPLLYIRVGVRNSPETETGREIGMGRSRFHAGDLLSHHLALHGGQACGGTLYTCAQHIHAHHTHAYPTPTPSYRIPK